MSGVKSARRGARRWQWCIRRDGGEQGGTGNVTVMGGIVSRIKPRSLHELAVCRDGVVADRLEGGASEVRDHVLEGGDAVLLHLVVGLIKQEGHCCAAGAPSGRTLVEVTRASAIIIVRRCPIYVVVSAVWKTFV